MIPTVTGLLASTVAQQVVEKYPQIRLRMVDAYGSFLVDWLHSGEIDMAVINGPAQDLHLDSELLRHDEMYVVGAVGSGLAKTPTVSLASLSGRPLVLPSPPHALRLLIDKAFEAAKLVSDVKVEADSFQALLDIVGGASAVGSAIPSCRCMPPRSDSSLG
jgi:DNA-binding transcriptional LysR family regulator